jgi:hypothetical protein
MFQKLYKADRMRGINHYDQMGSGLGFLSLGRGTLKVTAVNFFHHPCLSS